MVSGVGREDLGMYIFKRHFIQPSYVNRFANNAQLPYDSSVLWRRIMGHTPIEVLKKHDALHHLKYKDHVCIVFPLAKYAKLPIQSRISVSKPPFHIFHYDIWGPYVVPTITKGSLIL